MSEYYWELVQHDGTMLEIPPDKVDIIKRRMEQGQPINTTSMVIPVNQVKYFRRTSKPYNPQKLIEDVAQAFNEPVLSEDGTIQAKWVKKEVTQAEYLKYYTHGYRKLSEDGGMVTIAFRLAIHDIDVNKTPYLTDEEVKYLTEK